MLTFGSIGCGNMGGAILSGVAKLEKWQTHLINPHIILSKEPQGFVADATINTPNGVLV